MLCTWNNNLKKHFYFAIKKTPLFKKTTLFHNKKNHYNSQLKNKFRNHSFKIEELSGMKIIKISNTIGNF